MNRPKKPKLKRYTVTLTELDVKRLSAYADSSGLDRPAALHRLLKQSLRESATVAQGKVDKQQLGLFDTLQIDIFANTSVVRNNE